MKKLLITAGILSALVLSSPSVFAADGRINFTGEILDASCKVSNTEANPLIVNLGKVSKKSFPATGSTAASTSFKLTLTGCPKAVTSASLKFDGVSDNGNNNIIALTAGTGVATGVGVQITDEQNVVIPLSTETSSIAIDPNAEETDLGFLARYISTAATVTPGPANATATFTMTYN